MTATEPVFEWKRINGEWTKSVVVDGLVFTFRIRMYPGGTIRWYAQVLGPDEKSIGGQSFTALEDAQAWADGKPSRHLEVRATAEESNAAWRRWFASAERKRVLAAQMSPWTPPF